MVCSDLLWNISIWYLLQWFAVFKHGDFPEQIYTLNNSSVPVPITVVYLCSWGFYQRSGLSRLHRPVSPLCRRRRTCHHNSIKIITCRNLRFRSWCQCLWQAQRDHRQCAMIWSLSSISTCVFNTVSYRNRSRPYTLNHHMEARQIYQGYAVWSGFLAVFIIICGCLCNWFWRRQTWPNGSWGGGGFWTSHELQVTGRLRSSLKRIRQT